MRKSTLQAILDKIPGDPEILQHDWNGTAPIIQVGLVRTRKERMRHHNRYLFTIKPRAEGRHIVLISDQKPNDMDILIDFSL